MSNYGLFERALRSANALVELRLIVQGLLDGGAERAAVLEELESFCLMLRESGRDEDEDTVLEIMDFLVGWCHPNMSF
jgi:hypothetical protein